LFAILDKLIKPPYSVKSLQTICSDGFCAKFEKPDELFAILDKLIKPPYSVKSLQTICSDGFCAKFEKPDELFAILDKLIKPPCSVKSLQTICNNSFCAKFDKPDELFAILDVLRSPPFSIPNLTSFVGESIASKFDDPDRLFATLRLIYTHIGKQLAISISRSNAFASRMYNDGFLDCVFSIYKHIKSLRTDTDGAMKLVFSQYNAKLMDAIDALDTKIKTVKSGSELWKFIKPFKFDPRDKGRPAYVAAISALKSDADASTSAKSVAASYDEADSECDSDGPES
jgi:hypothetical protein